MAYLLLGLHLDYQQGYHLEPTVMLAFMINTWYLGSEMSYWFCICNWTAIRKLWLLVANSVGRNQISSLKAKSALSHYSWLSHSNLKLPWMKLYWMILGSEEKAVLKYLLTSCPELVTGTCKVSLHRALHCCHTYRPSAARYWEPETFCIYTECIQKWGEQQKLQTEISCSWHGLGHGLRGSACW